MPVLKALIGGVWTDVGTPTQWDSPDGATGPPTTIGELTNVPQPQSPVVSPWAQTVSERVTHEFASIAARDAAPGGYGAGNRHSQCSVDTAHFNGFGGEWIECGAAMPLLVLPAHPGITGAVILNGSGFDFPNKSTGRRYKVSILAHVFKADLAGPISIYPVATGRTFPKATCNMVTPEGRSFYWSWIFEPGLTGGAFAAETSAGSLNIEATSHIIIEDCGGRYPMTRLGHRSPGADSGLTVSPEEEAEIIALEQQLQQELDARNGASQ